MFVKVHIMVFYGQDPLVKHIGLPEDEETDALKLEPIDERELKHWSVAI